MRAAGLFLLPFSLWAVSGQEPARVVDGMVVNGATNEPIEGAVVSVSGAGEQPLRAVTGVDGRFSFQALPQSSLEFQAARRGFRTETGSDVAVLALHAGAPGQGVRLKLFPLCVIHGRVTNKDGEPILGVTVQALRITIRDGRRQVTETAAGRSNDLGEFRLWYLDSGRYYVRVAGRRQSFVTLGEAAVSRVEESYGPVYYPSSPAEETAQVLRLSPGETFRADFTLEPRAAFTVSGKLLNLPPYKQVRVSLINGGVPAGGRVVVNEASGAFEISGVPPGAYTLRAETADGLTGEATVSLEDRSLADLAVVMTAGESVAGTVTGWAVGGGKRRGSIAAEPLSSGSPRFTRFAQVEADGGFVLEKLTPGRYKIRVWADGYYPAAIRAGDADVLKEGLVVGALGTPPELEIELAAGGGTVSGTVRGVESETAAFVAVIDESGELAAPVARAPGIDHRFRVGLLPPGTYRVYAWAEGAEIEYRNPQALQGLNADSVSVASGETREITVRAMARGEN